MVQEVYKLEDLETLEEKFYYSILVLSMMFQELSRHSGFGTLATTAGFEPSIREFFFDNMSQHFRNNFPTIKSILQQWNPGVTPQNVQPYLLSSGSPNVLSFLHLVSQSLCEEMVQSTI
jgi:hypothetical protein